MPQSGRFYISGEREENMIAAICLLIPSLVLIYLRERIVEQHSSFRTKAFICALSLLGLNFMMLGILYFIFDSKLGKRKFRPFFSGSLPA